MIDPEIRDPPLDSFKRPILDTSEQRRALFSILSHVLIRARDEFDNTESDSARRAWGRLIATCALSYGKLLEGVELSVIMDELEQAEKLQQR